MKQVHCFSWVNPTEMNGKLHKIQLSILFSGACAGDVPIALYPTCLCFGLFGQLKVGPYGDIFVLGKSTLKCLYEDVEDYGLFSVNICTFMLISGLFMGMEVNGIVQCKYRLCPGFSFLNTGGDSVEGFCLLGLSFL